MAKKINNIEEASRETASLPGKRTVKLTDGQDVVVWRLSWLKFEALWGELSSLLATLLAEGAEADAARMASELAGAPQFIVKLVSLSTNLPDTELARWGFDDVLAVGAEALQLNFVESSGVRSFFTALSAITQDAA